MRLILSFFAVSVLLLSSLSFSGEAWAEDGFGSRFTNEMPSAFADPVDGDEMLSMDDAAQILQDIMPAAGGDDEVSIEGQEAGSVGGLPQSLPQTLDVPAVVQDDVELGGK